jgi:hypothetical protein
MMHCFSTTLLLYRPKVIYTTHLQIIRLIVRIVDTMRESSR